MLPVYGIIAIAGLVVSAAIASGAFDYDRELFGTTGFALAFFLALCFPARWLGFAGLAGIAESILLFLTVAILMPFCAVILATSNLPIADPALSAIDRALFGFDRHAFVASVAAASPGFIRAMIWVYNSLTVQPFLLLAILFLTRRAVRAWTLLTAWSCALALCVAVSALVPAYGTPPYALEFIAVLDGARDGSLRLLAAPALTGIVTFPRFHAAGAAMLAWGFHGLPGGRAMIALNAVMVVSALFVGGHYLIDLIAGLGVAAAAIWGAKRMQARLVR
ncbi:phosphatase PAP2 family protein [Sphingomonas soli]|uniref:phosphatase PAP2 family protein n=1 Tax=Sphingomonas soli TaxID=266127 RepID=UPI00146FFFAA|nr:phosphatase PAP2 family protein [Sphingomonas soli]